MQAIKASVLRIGESDIDRALVRTAKAAILKKVNAHMKKQSKCSYFAYSQVRELARRFLF